MCWIDTNPIKSILCFNTQQQNRNVIGGKKSMKCNKCGQNEEFLVKKNGKHLSLYCKSCGN